MKQIIFIKIILKVVLEIVDSTSVESNNLDRLGIYYNEISKGNNGPTKSYFINLLFKNMKDNVNKCQKDLHTFKSALIKQEEWAMKMLDSSSHMQSGVLQGNTINYGNYKECLGVKNTSNQMESKYCTIFNYLFDEIPSVTWKKNLKYSSAKQKLLAALCVPQSCDKFDIVELLNNFIFKDPYIDCITANDFQTTPTKTQMIIMTILITVFLVILFSTIFEIASRHFKTISTETIKRLILRPIIRPLSISLNRRNLLRKDKNDLSIKCIHGLRFIASFGIIIVHRNLDDPQPFSNAFQLDHEILKLENTIVMNAYLFVDLFFLLSGLLVSYTFLIKREYKKPFKPVRLFFHRYIRLTPTLGVTIMLALLFNYFCDGFFCTQIEFKQFGDTCQKNWFYNFFYVSNFISPHKICLQHTWYLSADMQLFILSFLLLAGLRKKKYKIIVYIIIAVLSASSMITVFIISYVYNLYSVPIGGTDQKTIMEARYVYQPFYTRAGPWLIGFGLGMVLHDFNKRPKKIDKRWAIIGWTISILCILISIFGMNPFFQIDFVHDRNMLELFYKSTYRSVWALGFAWIIYACYTGHGGLVDDFLSCAVFHPMSKISYCIYLLHPFAQKWQNANRIDPRLFEDKSQLVTYLGDLFYAIIGATILYLFIEAPILNLEKQFIIYSKAKNHAELKKVNSIK